MKKITFLLAFVAIATFSFAQATGLRRANMENLKKAVPALNSRAGGDVIWEEDFDGANWESTTKPWLGGLAHDYEATLPTHENGGTWQFKDNTDNSFYWHWSNHGPRGTYVSEGGNCLEPLSTVVSPNVWPEGTSLDNGYMLFEAAFFNTDKSSCNLVNPPLEMDSYIEFGPIDFSSYTAVIFNIKTLYRFCCSSNSKTTIKVQFSSEPDVWGPDHRFNLNTATNDITTFSERDFYENVTLEVAGKSDVYFRISVVQALAYYAIIDDIKFMEAKSNDIVMNDWWYDYMFDATITPAVNDPKTNFWGGYTEIPKPVVSEFIQFRSAVINNGSQVAENVKVNVDITKDGTSVFQKSGENGVNLDPGYKDSIVVVTNYTPTEIGNYQVSMTVSMDAADDDFDNNGFGGYSFKVVDDRYSKVYHGQEDDFTYAGTDNWVGGGTEGDCLAQSYVIPQGSGENGKVKLKGISVYIAPYPEQYYADEVAAIEEGKFYMIGKIWQEKGEAIEFINIETEPYTLEISDTASWVTIDFKDQNLTIDEDNELYVGIETYTGANNAADQKSKFRLGVDATNKSAGSMGLCYLLAAEGGAKWILSRDNYAIDLILDTGNSIAESNVFAGLSLYPNPVNDELVISGLNSNIKTVTISNVIGQTVMTVPAENASTIYLGNLNKGVYLVTFVDAQNNVETKRIIKN